MTTRLLESATGPLGILLVSVVFVIAAIGIFRLHAFFTLIAAAMIVGLLSAINQTGDERFLKVIDAVMGEFGLAMSRIGFSVAMAAVIGLCLTESGAADKIVRRCIAVLGERRVAIALLGCGFVLAAPVFAETVMMLLLPLGRTLSLRTGKNYLLYVLCICGGAAVSNGVVPPAPGPLFIAESLHLNLGIVIVAGFSFGLVPLTGTYLLARFFDRRIHVPVRATLGSTLESLAAVGDRPESELPSFLAAVAPVVVPMLLIAGASLINLARIRLPHALAIWAQLLGNKNLALAIGGFIAVVVYARQRRIGWRTAGKILGVPLETAGVIILIISAGGAYGAMVKNAGVGEAVRRLAGGHAINFVVLAWLLSAVIRAAQGSATVAVITAVGIMLSIAGPAGFGVHPLYILLAIGFGSKFLGWMNDAGFWVICRLGGLTQEETLGSWTIMVSLVSFLGLLEVWLVSSWFPHPHF